MSEEEVDISSGAAWRSKKYMLLSDEEILELAAKKLGDKDLLYLGRELDFRNLNESAKKAKRAAVKKEMWSKPWWKYAPLLIGLIFFIRRMFNSF